MILRERWGTSLDFHYLFWLQAFLTSKDIKTNEYHLSNETWIKLARFFKKQDTVFEIPVTEESSK